MNIRTTLVLGSTLFSSLALGGFATLRLMPTPPSSVVIHDLVVARDISVYAEQSDAVVIGTVVEIGGAHWARDHTMIQREVELSVEQTLKGDPTVTRRQVVVEGGTVGERSVMVEDGVRFTPGERVLLFLGRNARDDLGVFAGAYGKYSIDDQGTAVSVGDYRAPLEDLQDEILDALEASDQ